MLLRSSAVIYPGVHLVTLGNTCRYLISGDSPTTVLSDPGCTAHVTFLEDRFARIGAAIKDIGTVIVTHCDADRIGGIPLLRRLNPRIQVVGSANMVAHLSREDTVREIWEEDRHLTKLLELEGKVPHLEFPEFRDSLRIDRHLVESDVVTVDQDTLLRLVGTPGHRNHSVSYLLLPHEFVITDETFGYFQGRRLAAPGGNFDLETALASIKKFSHIDVSGIGFPYAGAITGEIIRKHLDGIAVNTADLMTETAQALREGVPHEEIRTQIRDAFFVSSLRDPCVLRSLEATFEAVWQLLALSSKAA
jgi:glyoxylase-like metal-dependent hydrolase (beta-lactamase superfamily II)